MEEDVHKDTVSRVGLASRLLNNTTCIICRAVRECTSVATLLSSSRIVNRHTQGLFQSLCGGRKFQSDRSYEMVYSYCYYMVVDVSIYNPWSQYCLFHTLLHFILLHQTTICNHLQM